MMYGIWHESSNYLYSPTKAPCVSSSREIMVKIVKEFMVFRHATNAIPFTKKGPFRKGFWSRGREEPIPAFSPLVRKSMSVVAFFPLPSLFRGSSQSLGMKTDTLQFRDNSGWLEKYLSPISVRKSALSSYENPERAVARRKIHELISQILSIHALPRSNSAR